MKFHLIITLFLLSFVSYSQSLPSSVDNSKEKYFPPIFSQIGNSCSQASSIGYVFTYEANLLLDTDASFMENRFSYLFTWNFINGGQDVGALDTDAYDLSMSTGIMKASDFPTQVSAYTFRWASGYEKYINAFRYRVKRTIPIDAKGEDGILRLKKYLFNKDGKSDKGGIVTFGSATGNWRLDNNYQGPSNTGYKSILVQLATEGAHAMTIVGYDDAVEFSTPSGDKFYGAFIVANSWGSFMHDDGRFYLPYYFFTIDNGDYKLRTDVNGIEVEIHKPKIVFKVGLTYTSRDDLSFSIGVADKPYSVTPMHNYQMRMAQKQGGDYPMQGSGSSADMEFAFNFTNYIGRLDLIEEPNFFLTIERYQNGKLGEGSLNYFSVLDYRENEQNPIEYVYKIDRPINLVKGKNLFSVATTEAKTTSASSVKLIGDGGAILKPAVVFKTANGKYAKVKFVDYDKKTKKLTIKYKYIPDGGRTFDNN